MHASTSFSGTALCGPCCTTRSRLARRGRQALTVKAIGWDPEGILSRPEGGHINRRTWQKTVENDQELKTEMEAAREKARAELIAAREARKLPTSNEEVLQFFLDTAAEEMEFEVARCRPMLTPDFMAHLERTITSERLNASPNEQRLGELSMLQQYFEEALEMLDKTAETLAAPADRLRKLLTAKDKAAMLYEMAGNNEIDGALMELLQQNVEGARAAGNEDAVKFLEKIAAAARKFVMTTV